MMVAETEHGRFGFVVDQVLGDHQTVIKNLGRLYSNVQVVSGCDHSGRWRGGVDSGSAPAGAERVLNTSRCSVRGPCRKRWPDNERRARQSNSKR